MAASNGRSVLVQIVVGSTVTNIAGQRDATFSEGRPSRLKNPPGILPAA